MLTLQLTENTVEAFDARLSPEFAYARFAEFALEVVLGFFETLLILVLALFEKLARFLVVFWIGKRERGVFEFLLGYRHTEPIGNGCVYLECLKRDARALFFLGNKLERAGVVQTVHQ